MAHCPSCNLPLRVVVESEIEIDVCDRCNGVWLDPGELDSLVDSNDVSLHEVSSHQRVDLQCPACSTQAFALIRTSLGSFARCADCGGVFVSGKTLDRISKCEREELPGKKAIETTVGSADLLHGLLDLLWLFTHH